jgi:carbonic anhydrase
VKERWLRVLLCAVVTILITPVLSGQEPPHEQYVSPWRTPWTYEGAAHWSELDPQYAACNTGKEQSPINIENAQAADLPPLAFESKSTPLRYVINNRYTIRVNYHAGNGNFLQVGDKRYQLTQFHFHHPSEEQIGGKAYPMEVHLMYQASDGAVAGVTVFVHAGSANSTVKTIWENMPRSEGQQEVAGSEISPAGLLPSEKVRAYYMYMGSVTAPPCTEGVTWFVLKAPIDLSAGQIDAFAKLFPDDARPLQPLNGRVVKESR